MVDLREKAWEEAVAGIVPDYLDSNDGQNSEVISDDEDNEDTVHSNLQHQKHCNIWTSCLNPQ